MKVLLFLIELFPALVAAVKAAESLFPESGKGKEKLELVKAYLESAWKVTGEMKQSFEEMWPKIKPIIDTIVTTFNTLGIFKK